MPSIILFDDQNRNHLLPLCFTRSIADCRTGIFTARERWSFISASDPEILAPAYLNIPLPEASRAIYINSAILPSPELIDEILNLPFSCAMKSGDIIIAYHAENSSTESYSIPSGHDVQEAGAQFHYIKYPWEIFLHAGDGIKWDHQIRQRIDRQISARDGFFTNSSILLQPENTFIHEEARLSACTINAAAGPVIIEKGAQVMEGALLRGPIYLGKNSTIKMGAKIYGPTIIGPHSKVGGEVTNSVIFGYSNKGHEGYLGNSVIGQWCNLGADTNTSNLKNNYSPVSVHSYAEGSRIDTGQLFCGLIMGDHSKAGINTMFNTGTVVGVGANIFGSGFPKKHIPSFSWGGAESITSHQFDKFLETARRVYARRELELTETEINTLKHIYSETAIDRPWERDIA